MVTRLIFLVLFFLLIPLFSHSDENILVFDKPTNKVKIMILDKITSKKIDHLVSIGKISIINNFKVKIVKCIIDNKTGSSDIYAFLQVQDQKNIKT